MGERVGVVPESVRLLFNFFSSCTRGASWFARSQFANLRAQTAAVDCGIVAATSWPWVARTYVESTKTLS